MKKLILLLFMLFCSSLEACIENITIWRRFNADLNKYHYVINCGDIHDLTPELNEEQVEGIKFLISKSNGLFLFEAFTSNQIQNATLAPYYAGYKQLLEFTAPVSPIFLRQYAESIGKRTEEIDIRYAMMFPFMLSVILSNYPHTKFPIKELSNLILEPYFALKKLIHVIIENIKMMQVESTLKNDCEIFLQIYEQKKESFKKDKKFAQSLGSIEDDMIDHCVANYAAKNNLDKDSIKAQLINELKKQSASEVDRIFLLNLSGHLGETITVPLISSLRAMIELLSLKAIIEKQEYPAFVFSGILHSLQLNGMLRKLKYEKIYEAKSETNLQSFFEQCGQLSNVEELLKHGKAANLKALSSKIFYDLAEDGFLESLKTIDSEEDSLILENLMSYMNLHDGSEKQKEKEKE